MATVVALKFEDGTIGRMQFLADVSDELVTASIAKTKFKEGAVTEWRRVDLESFPQDREQWANSFKL